MTEQVFKVRGMHCQSCVANVREAVEELDGVSEVEVDLAAERVTVRGEVDHGAVREAISSAGYQAA